MSRVSFRPSADSEYSPTDQGQGTAALAAAFTSTLNGGGGTQAPHAAEEDTAFIAESNALLRSSTAQLRDPLFVPVQMIVDMMKANDEVRAHRMGQIRQSFDEVSGTLRNYVHRHYDSFNDSIDYFSQLIRRISDAQHTVATSHVDLSNVQGMLQCRALELEAHFRRAARSILVKRMLRSVIDCAKSEARVLGLLRQRRFVAAAATVARTREVLQQPQLRGVQSLSRLVTFSNKAADHIKRSAFDFLLGTVFLRGEVEDRRAMLAAIRRAGGQHDSASSSSSSVYLADVSRDAPLFDAVKQAIGAFRDLGALQDVPKLLCNSAVACIEQYFTAFVAAYATHVRDDFSAEQILQAKNLANINNIGSVGPNSAGVSISTSSSSSSASPSSPSSSSLLTGSSHLLTEERRSLAEAQRPAVSAFFQRVLRQAAVILQNLQRVVDIVLEEELPFFRSSRAAAEVWKALIASSWSADSWSVEECTFPPSRGVVAQKIIMNALARVRDDAASIGGEVAAAVDLAFGVSGVSPTTVNRRGGGGAGDVPSVIVPQWITEAANNPNNSNFGALLRQLMTTARALCSDVSSSTQNAVAGLLREHLLSSARETVAGELRQLGAGWDLTAVWDAVQRLFITMSRVLCGVPAARSQKDDEADKQQQEQELLKWEKRADGADAAAAAADGKGGASGGSSSSSSSFQDEGRIGLEKLAYLLGRRDRSSGLPKYMDDFGVVQVRMSTMAEFLIRDDISPPPGSPTSNRASIMLSNIPASPTSSQQQINDYVFPKVVSSIESALNQTIVPVAGNARSVWLSLEPFVGVVQSVLCLGRASVSPMFSDLGTVMSRQLLTQAHNFWMLRVTAVMAEEQKRVTAAVLASSSSSSPSSSNDSSKKPNSNINSKPHRMLLVAATSTTSETRSAQRPVLEVVDCSIRSVHLDFGPLAQRGMAHGGLSHELSLAAAERAAVLLETVVGAAGKKLWAVCEGTVSARAFVHHRPQQQQQRVQDEQSCWSDLVTTTMDTPLAVLAGAPDLWETPLSDLRDNTSAAVATASTSTLFLTLDGVAFVATTAYSFELLAETVEEQVMAPLLSNSSSSEGMKKEPQVLKLSAILAQCRGLFRDALAALSAHVLGIVLHKAAEMRNDAVFSATTCSQRPSLFASELCNDLRGSFSVLDGTLLQGRRLWLASLLAAPTAKLLLEEAVNVRDRRFTAAGVDQLVYDTLALESTVKSLVINPSSSSSAAVSDDDAATFLEMVSKPFRRPLEFFRLLRRSNDTERASVVQDIITRRLHQRFSQEEMETLVELVMRGHKGAATGGLVEQHKARLREFIDSTYHSRSRRGGGGSSSSPSRDDDVSAMLRRAESLFGSTVEMRTPTAAPAAASPTKKSDREDDEEDEEEFEEEEEEEEEDEVSSKEQTPVSPPSPSAATKFSETMRPAAATPSSSVAPSPAPVQPPVREQQQPKSNNSEQSGGSEFDEEEFEEFEEFEEGEADDDDDAPPPPPPAAPPSSGAMEAPAPAAAPGGGRMSLRDRLAAMNK